MPVFFWEILYLNCYYRVDEATNGKVGYEKIINNYYDAIISDIDMPELNVDKMLEMALEKKPYIKKKFIFHTGFIPAQREKYFKGNGMKFLRKPSDFSLIKENIDEIVKAL